MGYSVVGHCGGDFVNFAMAGVNLLWAESGSNPRDRKQIR
ncbi:hypothetical protein Ga0466249_003506 [Sporomusaceae bacterium BoRhaA]|nr:hypothetical protein [Pelorhabdus rhamnosifermentans]